MRGSIRIALLLEERLKEHAEFILNLNGEKEKIEATERYIKDESDRELFLGGNLPDYIWRLLFHVHKYSNVARRYVEILAKKTCGVYKSCYALYVSCSWPASKLQKNR